MRPRSFAQSLKYNFVRSPWHHSKYSATGYAYKVSLDLLRESLVPIFWSKSINRPNFGDELTPYIVQALSGLQPYWCPLGSRSLVGAGSVLEWIGAQGKEKPIRHLIWGSGLMYEHSRVALPLEAVLGLRGKLSLERIFGGHDVGRVSLGDPGLLSSVAFPSMVEKKEYGALLILHYAEDKLVWVPRMVEVIPDLTVASVHEEPLELMQKIAASQVVISSALHPLIVADAYRVPNAWLLLSDLVKGDGFKFHDYYSAFGIQPKPYTIASATQYPTAFLDQVTDGYARTRLEDIQYELMLSLGRALGALI